MTNDNALEKLNNLFKDFSETKKIIFSLKKEYKKNPTDELENSLAYYQKKFDFLKKSIKAYGNYFIVNLNGLSNEFKKGGLNISIMPAGKCMDYKFFGRKMIVENFICSVIYPSGLTQPLFNFYYGGNSDDAMNKSSKVDIDLMLPVLKNLDSKDEYADVIKRVYLSLIAQNYSKNGQEF